MLTTTEAIAKIRIITFHYNKPDFIELQHKCFKKFMSDDYEILVFNDAATMENELSIKTTCERLGIQCIRFQPEWHLTDPLNQKVKNWMDNPDIYSHINFNRYPEVLLSTIQSQPSIRHCHVIQYALDNYGYNHNDIIVILDGDAFPIRKLDLRRMLKRTQIAGIERLISEEDVSYLWVPFIAFNPTLKNNPNIRFNKILGHSSTGYYHWTYNEIYQAGYTADEAWLIKNLPWPTCVEFHMNSSILHFAGSSFNIEGHEVKSQYVHEFINRITN
jgi:hypothetical protein